MNNKHIFSIGDSVIIKPGIQDPDFGFDIGGWQGRVSKIEPEQGPLCIDFDSITLEAASYAYIAQCEEGGFGWDQIYLGVTDVEPAQARDTLADVKKVYERLQGEHAWDFLGSAGEITRQVLKGIDPDDDFAAFEAWEKHFSHVIKFPFEAEIAEFQERGPLRTGSKVRVHSISSVEDLYGVIVKVTQKHHTYYFPLCDLEATDTESETHNQIQSYAVWFANR